MTIDHGTVYGSFARLVQTFVDIVDEIREREEKRGDKQMTNLAAENGMTLRPSSLPSKQRTEECVVH